MILAMLEHQDAIRFQEPLLEDQAGDGGQLLQGVGRIGEDEVELLLARLDEAEHVAAKGQDGRERVGRCGELLQTVADKTVVVTVQLDTDDMGTAARGELKGDAARAGEQIEGCRALQVDVAIQHVEDVLLGKVGSGPCLERPRYVEVPSFVSSSNDSHLPLMI